MKVSAEFEYQTMALFTELTYWFRSRIATCQMELPGTKEWNLAETRTININRLTEYHLQDMARPQIKYLDRPERVAVRRFQAMVKAFDQVPEFKLAASASQPKVKEMNSLRRLAKSFGDPLKNRDRAEVEMKKLAMEGRTRLEALASQVQMQLCGIEREAVLVATAKGLDSLGYQAKVENHRLTAARDRHLILAEADPLASLRMDYSGYSNLTCLEEANKVEEALKKQGLRFQRVGCEHHRHRTNRIIERSGDEIKTVYPVFQKVHGLSQVQSVKNRDLVKEVI